MKNYKIKNQNLNVPSESISTHCEALGLCLPEFINALVKGDLEFTGQRNFFFLLSNSDPVILHYKSTEPSTIKLRTSVCFLFVAPSYSRTTEFKKTCSYFNQSKDIVISSARLWLVEGQEEGRNFRCTVVQLYDGATETDFLLFFQPITGRLFCQNWRLVLWLVEWRAEGSVSDKLLYKCMTVRQKKIRCPRL